MEGGDDTLNLYGGSTITGRIDGGVGADTLNLFGPGTGTLSNVINFEVLNVQGGVWTVTDAQSYQNGATIGSGATLLVNGSLGNAVTVNAGGTLGGNGSVGNVLVDGGTLSPGNSIGTLTVQGSLTFTTASTYLVEVSAAASDRTNVTGAATLGGAAVNASFTGTTFQKQYTILNAAGGVSGSFAGPVNSNLPSNLISSLSYDANNVYLNLALNFAATGKLSGNQAAVGNAITNSFNSTGSVTAAFGVLTPAGLTQASGELGTGSQQTTFDAMNMFLGVMTDSFTEGRGGMSANGGASQFAGDTMSYASTGMSRAKAARDAYAAIYRKAPPQQTFEQRWSVWAAGFGGGQSTDGGTAVGSNSTTSRIFGVAVGADYRISPDTIAGLALAGGGTNFTVANALGGGRSDLFQTGAFIRHGFGPAYLLGALAYGWQDVTTDRTVTIAGIDRLRAQFNANALSGRIEGGYRFITPWSLALTPYAAGQFTTYDLPSYAELVLSGSSAFAVAYGAKTVTATRSELGVRSDRSIALQDGILSLRGRLAWAHDYNTDRSVAATFQTLPGASFVVNGAAPASDAVLTTASAAMNWTSGWSAALTFEGEFSDVTSSYGGKGVVRYTW
ncbi:autotransporter outer membrane beta-barrel domain-containing protein [Bradyrhizobium elkanii]|nr:autotransporter domain-containing protein [Bradyrhizobium elkanii]